jgi:hypothetical protein
LTRRARYQYALAISAVLLLSIGLRLIFILDVSRIPVVWDAEIYWSLAVGIRNLICTSLKYCSPDIYAHTETMQVALRSIFVDRYGLLPASMAAALTVLPTDPKSVYFVFAILDCLVCMMAMNIASRLGLPLWAATLAGLSSAIYVPAVVSTASFLQQPFIRFWLVFATWNYARALTAGPDRRIGGSILLGTFASFVVGFSSTTTRPLMWVLPIAVVFIGSFTADRQFRNLQLKCLVALLALLGIVLASVRAVIPDISTINLISDLAIGIPIDRAGSDQLQVTVLSFRDFWPPTAWYPDSVPFATRSLFQDMVRAPFSFAYWLNYSIYCNWLFPDHLYFQQYLLNISEQNIQHWIVVVLGLAGIACLLGQPGPRRNIGILIAVLVLFISLSNGMISVEPRRLTTLAPFLSVGLAYCVWIAFQGWSPRRFLIGGLLAGASVVIWKLPAPILFAWSMPVEFALAVLAVARVSVVLTLIVHLANMWKRGTTEFHRTLPIAFMIVCLSVAGIGSLEDGERREWSARIAAPINQAVDQLKQPEYLWPWLLVDVENAQQATSLSISINGEQVKAPGTSMSVWEAGDPPQWRPYAQLFEIAGTKFTRRMWWAIPVPRHLTESGKMNIELTSAEPVSIRGDLLEPGSQFYTGPLFEPWINSQSFWRWIWNASDPRISRPRPLTGVRYTSSYLDGNRWNEDDLSSSIGKQTGFYRIFVEQAAFGPRTNALERHHDESGTISCQSGSPLQDAGAGLPYICRQQDGLVEYFIGGERVGASQRHDFLAPMNEENQLISRFSNEHGAVDIIRATNKEFVANFYSTGRSLIYSMVFRPER